MSSNLVESHSALRKTTADPHSNPRSSKLRFHSAIFALTLLPSLLCAQSLIQQFEYPPADARPMMRWWWFGPAVTPAELKKELDQMHSVGIGGVEIQPVYPELADDPAKGIKNLTYLSKPFLDAVGYANTYARSLGMRVDITLGSGWPYGGPSTTPENAARRLKLVETAVAPNSSSIPYPALSKGDSLIAAFVAAGSPGHWSSVAAHQLPLPATTAGSLATPAASTVQTALFFVLSHTNQAVKRSALGAEGPVLDHFSRAAIDQHLAAVATPLLSAFGPNPPTAVFSDSLEVYGADWTPNLLSEFQRRRGYDLLPHLPELVSGDTPQSLAIRHDWGVTLSDLVRDDYLTPLTQFASDHDSKFRSQTYGEPAVTLFDESVAALPEGEGPQWRAFSFTRWASSASHAYNRKITSAETWTWLHSPAFRATPLDMKVEADRMFLEGVNQLVGHGWPYSPPSLGEPGQSLYAAASFNAHNPWWPVMPDVMRYLQRASWLLRQGEPANDIVILLPEDDAQASFSPGHVAVTDAMKTMISPELMTAILDAGYNVDYIDAATIDRVGINHPVLLLPPTDRIPLATYRKIEAYTRAGGKLIALGRTPSLAPGLRDAGDSSAISALSKSLFQATSRSPGTLVSSLGQLPAALHKALPPDLALAAPSPELGFLHRHLPDSDIYFIVNSSNADQSIDLKLRADRPNLEQWDLERATRTALNARAPLHFDLPPYASTVLILSDRPAAGASRAQTQQTFSVRPVADLSQGWTIAFAGEQSEQLPNLVSWTALEPHRYFSGEASYHRTFDLTATPKRQLWLDFGNGTPTTDTRPPNAPGIHALLDPPIREAAEIFVNGQRAGSLWHPPYRLDISAFVKPGQNQLEIRVQNTAINHMAGEPAAAAMLPPRGYAAANVIYGVRATPQEMDHLEPIPSGLVDRIQLLEGGAAR